MLSLSSLAVHPGAQNGDYLLGSDACDHDQFPARAEEVGTQRPGLSFFTVSMGSVFLSVIATGFQPCDGEGKERKQNSS